MSVPGVLDATLKEIVVDALPEVDILSIRPEPAVAAGEHYLSTLLRINVTFRPKNKNGQTETTLILKAQPLGVLSGFVNECDMFLKEMVVYNKIASSINQICGKNITPAKLGRDRYDILVLEDLKIKGFQMKNRVDKLDFEHAKEALISLADFHAASMIAHERNPELFDEIKVEKIYNDDNVFMRSFVTNTFTTAGEEFEKVSHLTKYGRRLREAGEKTWTAVKNAVIPKDNKINVLNHGDFWTTNILYSYDDQNNIKEIRFVDFQFTRWGSPAFDLQMLYTTSLRDRSSIPKLTSIYLERLNTHLQSNELTAESLEEDMRSLDSYGFITSVCTMPICILNPKNPLNFSETTMDDFNDDFKDRPNPYLTALKDEKYLKIIPEYLEFYEERGLL